MNKNSLEFTAKKIINPWSGSTFSQDAGPSTRKQENTQLVDLTKGRITGINYDEGVSYKVTNHST